MMSATTSHSDSNKNNAPPAFSVEKEAYDKARTMIEGGASMEAYDDQLPIIVFHDL